MNNPCETCITRAMCKHKFTQFRNWYIKNYDTSSANSVIKFSNFISCGILIDFFNDANQEDVNQVRIFYGLSPYK
jgi:hypothetical protein